MENATLDEFGVDDEDQNGGDSDELESPTPDTPTSSFNPEGADCHLCGESVLRRWRFDAKLVCGACKDWAKQG